MGKKNNLDYLINGEVDMEEYQRDLDKRTAFYQLQSAPNEEILPNGLLPTNLSPDEMDFFVKWNEAGIQATNYAQFKNYGLLITNEEQQKWSFAGSSFPKKIFNYSDILSCEFNESVINNIEGNSGSALLGGILFGGVGAIGGASGSKDITGVCQSMSLHLTLSVPEFNSLSIEFLNGPLLTTSFEYGERKRAAQSLRSMFISLKAIGDKNNYQNNDSQENDFAKSIEKLFALKEKGMITEEEYNAKKKQILGI